MKKNVVKSEVKENVTVSKNVVSMFKVLLVTANKDDKRQFVLELSFFKPEQRREAVMRWHSMKGFETLAKCYGETSTAKVKLMFYHGTQQREVLSYQLDPKFSVADRIKEVKANNRKFTSFLEFYEKLGFEANGISNSEKKMMETAKVSDKNTDKPKRVYQTKQKHEILDFDDVKVGKRNKNSNVSILKAISESPVSEQKTEVVEAKKTRKPRRKKEVANADDSNNAIKNIIEKL